MSTLNAAVLFHWTAITFQYDPRVQRYICYTWQEFKKFRRVGNELLHSHPLTHSLFHFRIIVTSRCYKINSSIKPAPTSGLDLLGQPVTVTADVRPNSLYNFLTCCTHHCAIMTYLHWRWTSTVRKQLITLRTTLWAPVSLPLHINLSHE